MQDHELTAWLGTTTVTDEQRDALHRAWGLIDADDKGDEQERFTGAAMYVLGDTTLSERGSALIAARVASWVALQHAIGAAVAATQSGISEVTAAREAGIDRMTLRKALGK